MAKRVACLPPLNNTGRPDCHNSAIVAMDPRTPGCDLARGGWGTDVLRTPTLPWPSQGCPPALSKRQSLEMHRKTSSGAKATHSAIGDPESSTAGGMGNSGGRISLNQISVRGVCSTIHDGGHHLAPCLQYTVGTTMSSSGGGGGGHGHLVLPPPVGCGGGGSVDAPPSPGIACSRHALSMMRRSTCRCTLLR